MTTSIETNNTAKKVRRSPTKANGVDVDQFFGTLDVVAKQRELAKFQFRASNRWVRGTHSVTRLQSFSGAGGEHEHVQAYDLDADHPVVLCGEGHGPTPGEYLLGALAACLTAGIGNIASARGITLTSVESRVEGDIDLQGLLGLSDDVRNGYQRIKISFDIAGDASAEDLKRVVEQSSQRSAVLDVLTNGVTVDVEVNAI